MRPLNLIPLLLFFTVILSLGYSMHSSHNPKDYVYKLSNSELTLISGEKLNLKNFQGQFYVLHLFSSWCESCQKDYPLLKEIKEKTKAIIIGVAIKDESPKPNPIYDYIAIDQNMEIAKLLKNKTIPETFIVNPQGMVAFHYKEALSKEEIEKNIIPNINF